MQCIGLSKKLIGLKKVKITLKPCRFKSVPSLLAGSSTLPCRTWKNWVPGPKWAEEGVGPVGPGRGLLYHPVNLRTTSNRMNQEAALLVLNTTQFSEEKTVKEKSLEQEL